MRVPDPNHSDLRVAEILDKLKFVAPTPVIILAGATAERPGKTMAGIARAAYNTGAVILDSGVSSSIEKFCIRKHVQLLGVSPVNSITYPKISPLLRKPNELTNGHTHFFLVGKEVKTDKSMSHSSWGEESLLKL